MNDEMIKNVVSQVVRQCLSQNSYGTQENGQEIPVGVSGRHVHLTEEDVEYLFGKGYTLTCKRDISQPGQYVCEERVTIIGPENVFRNVAVLGPPRKRTQVEISLSDARALGVKAPVAMSGDLSNAADIMIASDHACVSAAGSLIVAKNHVHMSAQEAQRAGVKDGDRVDIAMLTDRPITFRNVQVRAGDAHKLEFHIDCDEANACLYKKGDRAIIIGASGSEMLSANMVRHEDAAAAESERKAEDMTAHPAHDDVLIGTKFLTEQQIRTAVQGRSGAIMLKQGTILSPLAKDYAAGKHIQIKYI